MTEREKIIERIEKLLRLSESTNQHEAELAAQRASELMTKHQISMTVLDVQNVMNDNVKQTLYSEKTIQRRWVPTLAQACAILFDGRVVVRSSTQIWFVGYDTDTQAAQMLFKHLYEAWFGIVNQDHVRAKREATMYGNKFRGASYKNSHGVAYTQSIYWRVKALVEERKAQVKSTSTGTSLIVVKDGALTEYMAQFRSNKAPLWSTSAAGQRDGHAAGNAAALGGAIEEGQ